jgi:hypothetical protein
MCHASRLATWCWQAANGLESIGVAHGGLRHTGPWTVGTVHGGPRPSLPLLSLAHGVPGASSGLGAVAPSSLFLTAVSSRVLTLWWLGEAAMGFYGIAGPRGVHWWAKGGTLVDMVPDVGVAADDGGAGRRQGRQGHRHNPNGVPTASGCFVSHGKGAR